MMITDIGYDDEKLNYINQQGTLCDEEDLYYTDQKAVLCDEEDLYYTDKQGALCDDDGLDELEDWGPVCDADTIEKFRACKIRTKQDICKAIDDECDRIRIRKKDNPDDETYCNQLIRLLTRLYKNVRRRVIFDAPEGMWQYVISYNCYGAKLKLCLVNGYWEGQEPWTEEDKAAEPIEYKQFITSALYETFDIITVDARLFTVEEYALLYGVKPVTVYQWIRRGKLRSAVKQNGEWRIPELAVKPNSERGYKTATYEWGKNEVLDYPDGYEFINDFNQVRITKLKDVPNAYELLFLEVYPNEKRIVLNSAEREKIELFFISNPMIKIQDTPYWIEGKY